MSDFEIQAIEKELKDTESLQPYNGFEQAYMCLVKLAHDEVEIDEFARIKSMVYLLRRDKKQAILQMREVDNLLGIDPPLETMLSHRREGLSTEQVSNAIQDIKTYRSSNPGKALRQLCYILKTIRNKRSHGFKTIDGPRDNEILSAAFPLTLNIANACVELRYQQLH